MSLELPPELDVDEGAVEALFARFRIPVDVAQKLLDQTLLTLVLRYPDLRSPRPWVMSTLKRRCIIWWRTYLRRVHAVFDIGLRAALTSPDHPEEARERMREQLRQWTASLNPRCREVLRRRYGLTGDEVPPPPESPGSELALLGDPGTGERVGSERPGAPSLEILECVGALLRRIRAEEDDPSLWQELLDEEDGAREDDETAEEG